MHTGFHAENLVYSLWKFFLWSPGTFSLTHKMSEKNEVEKPRSKVKNLYDHRRLEDERREDMHVTFPEKKKLSRFKSEFCVILFSVKYLYSLTVLSRSIIQFSHGHLLFPSLVLFSLPLKPFPVLLLPCLSVYDSIRTASITKDGSLFAGSKTTYQW